MPSPSKLRYLLLRSTWAKVEGKPIGFFPRCPLSKGLQIRIMVQWLSILFGLHIYHRIATESKGMCVRQRRMTIIFEALTVILTIREVWNVLFAPMKIN